jgi:hypothetical protein
VCFQTIEVSIEKKFLLKFLDAAIKERPQVSHLQALADEVKTAMRKPEGSSIAEP